jgi:WD40 repeat protein
MMVSTRSALLLGVMACFSALPHAGGAEENRAAQVSFSRDIAPILARKCLACHGPEKPKGNYRLDTFSRLLQPGHSKEPPIVPGSPDQSPFLQLLLAEDEHDRMPQKDDPLPPEEIRLIRVWIEQGAHYDGTDLSSPLAKLISPQAHPHPPERYPRPVPIRAVAFHPNGDQLAVGGYHEITIWNPENGTLLRRITGITERAYALAYSPDGEWLAMAGGIPGKSGEVALVKTSDESLKRPIAQSPDIFLSVVFSPDGTRLACAGADNAISVFDTLSGERQLLIQQHADWVNAIALSPDGALLASASRDRSARVYDSRTGELIATYQGHNGPVLAVAFSSDGKLVCTAGRDGKIHLWNALEGNKSGELAGAAGEVFQLRLAGDDLFSVSADKRLRHHGVKEKKLLRNFEPHGDWVYAVAIHPEKKRAASGSHDGEIRVWTWEGTAVSRFLAAPGFSLEAEGTLAPSP